MNSLLFIGTGAADWDINNKTDEFRRFSASLLNGDLMIDCGPHIFDFLNDNNNNELYDNVTDILITHAHDDHYNIENILKIASSNKIRLGCDEFVAKEIGQNPNIEFVIMEQYKPTHLGKYKIVPVLANHDVVIKDDKRAFHYIIETPDSKKIFYGLDGAWFLRPTWEEMKNHKFDLMILDCTVGDKADWRLFEHNTIPMLRFICEAIRDKDLLTDKGRIYASHFARTLHADFDTTASVLAKEGIVMSYDGLAVNF